MFGGQKGIKVGHSKETATLRPVRIRTCTKVTLLMKQHIGVPCRPLVKPGDSVRVGQKIGDGDGNTLCVPIHASLSGTVQPLQTVRTAAGEDVSAIVIASDGEMSPAENLSPPRAETLDEFIAAIRESGLVGLGGAGFPAYAKLHSAAGAANILLVNAAECEPYITADHRELLDGAEDIVDGIRFICRFLNIKEAVIGIEDNKGDAIGYIESLVRWADMSGVQLRTGVLKSRYPQGAEKMFIHSLTGRVVPLGKLPSAVGALVMNVGSVAFIGRYMRTGKPLVSRTVTIDGGAVRFPMNARVPIGISMAELIEFSGGVRETPRKIILGGPMMGSAAPNLGSAISKCNNAVLLLRANECQPVRETPCIRCGKCVTACPMRLMPCALESAYRAADTDALQKYNAAACIECGCCAYVCPAKREIAQRVRLGKRLLARTQTARNGGI
jgi:electron transport complex protein RnfC